MPPGRLILAALLYCSPAMAQEVRLGVLGHDVGVFGNGREQGVDFDLEIQFPSPPALSPVWSPRPHLGGSLNTLGETSQVYGGLTWSWSPATPVFVEFSLGGALHDGRIDGEGRRRKSLGSPVLFRESLSIGLRLDGRRSLSLMLSHVSNARLARRNQGLDQLGLRWGYRF